MFKGRRLVIATMHEKEQVLAPLLREGLNVDCFVPDEFNTDLFGTFSGEIERTNPAHLTVRDKCLKAMELTQCDLGVASEGSFGAHPSIPFIPVNEEMLIFIDRKNDLEIREKVIEIETNFSEEEVKNWEDLAGFANRHKFPSHGLILRTKNLGADEIIKGITDWEQLKVSYDTLIHKGSAIHVETDMRAMYNPTRMKTIEKACQKLIEKINSLCSQCHSPGFGITAAISGLPCSLCGMGTKSTLSYLYECQKCAFTSEEKYPHGKHREDPMYCDFCNP